jgi:lysozyme family protein
MTFDTNFVTSFNNAMKYEVGSDWNPNDPDTISGNVNTPHKCGYTNTAGDAGGLTKFGIALSENPSVDVANLDLNSAMQIYYTHYWLAGSCDKMASPLCIFHFDTCVNNGVPRAGKILQQAVGANPIDGLVGPATLALVTPQDPATLINTLSTIRIARYHTIVETTPSDAQFLNGWLRRVNEVTAFSLSQI